MEQPKKIPLSISPVQLTRWSRGISIMFIRSLVRDKYSVRNAQASRATFMSDTALQLIIRRCPP
jgi:hypothetical protein